MSTDPSSEPAPGLIGVLREDLTTHGSSLTEPGFLAIAVHRLGKRGEQLHGPAKPVAMAAHSFAATAIDWIWGIKIPLHVDLGRRIRIWHHGCVLLNAKSVGADVHIRHSTTFGPARADGGDDLAGLPIIEDGVEIGSGACILGPVRVGKGAIVGANTVVLKPVPERATVLGVPGRVVPS
jgi:serine O-acetyltransferase